MEKFAPEKKKLKTIFDGEIGGVIFKYLKVIKSQESTLIKVMTKTVNNVT